MRYCAICSGQTRAESAVFVGDMRFEAVRKAGFPGCEGGLDPCVIDGRVRLGAIVALPFPADRVAGCNGDGGGSENRFEIEAGVEADLLQ